MSVSAAHAELDEPRPPLVDKWLMIGGRPVHFTVGRFLGKGTFANVFQLDAAGMSAAAKAIDKALLVKQKRREMAWNEIEIHRCLRHEHIPEFHAWFEDRTHIYLVLELCPSRTLFDLHLDRGAIDEAETRGFIRQTISAVQYLHENLIVHRDIKLGNLFLSPRLQVKLGDFGMAVRLKRSHVLLREVLGTPNYIAPEVLDRRRPGYSLPVDVWALGICLYTLLVGIPPFETESIDETYKRIQTGQYELPASLSSSAYFLIKDTLHLNPRFRPLACNLEMYRWFSDEQRPAEPPAVSPPSPPPSQTPEVPPNTPAVEQKASECPEVVQPVAAETLPSLADSPPNSLEKSLVLMKTLRLDETTGDEGQLDRVIRLLQPWTSGQLRNPQTRELSKRDEFPAGAPLLWVTRWVRDARYGVGYELCDGTVGMLFNDHTRMALHADRKWSVQYTDANNNEHRFKLDSTDRPAKELKKALLLRTFKGYLERANLMPAGEALIRERGHSARRRGTRGSTKGGGDEARFPSLTRWYATASEMGMLISGGIFQVNNWRTHHKVVISTVLSSVTFISPEGQWRTFHVDALLKCGDHSDAHQLLRSAGAVARAMRQTDDMLVQGA